MNARKLALGSNLCLVDKGRIIDKRHLRIKVVSEINPCFSVKRYWWYPIITLPISRYKFKPGTHQMTVEISLFCFQVITLKGFCLKGPKCLDKLF